MRHVAWRLDRYIAPVNVRRQRSERHKCVQRMVDMRCILFKKGHDCALKLTRINA